MTEITKTIPVRISSSHLVELLVDALYERAKPFTKPTLTLFCALGYLVGISDVAAVRAVNRDARAEGRTTITVMEFRKWLPKMLSGIFEEWKMANIVHIELRNIPAHLEPGDAIECTVDGTPYKCEFVDYGTHHRIIWVRIFGLREISGGKLAQWSQPDLFGNVQALEFTTEFVVNDAPGTSWHRTAGMSAEVD